MRRTWKLPPKWLATMACAAALAACGGGGGGGTDSAAAPAATPDARNGDYVMYGADARQYTLSLDFDARTYQVAGNGEVRKGTFSPAPAMATGAVPDPAEFWWFDDMVTGTFRLASGLMPFIASRSFASTFADAAGTYDFLESTEDTAAASDHASFSGELLASGKLLTCSDPAVYSISRCPAASVATANVTVSGDEFTADTGTGTYSFRVAKVGAERIFLRAGAAAGTARQFEVGMPDRSYQTGLLFSGHNTNGQGTSTGIGLDDSYRSTWGTGSGSSTHAGTAVAPGGTASPGSLAIDAGADGSFDAISSSHLMVLVSAHGNTSWPEYIEIGKR